MLNTQKKSLSPFAKNILFTSQWIIASAIHNFIIQVVEQLEHENMDVGILFKPHPYDKNNYNELQKYNHIILLDKYEDTFKLFSIADIHSTVYSTSGLEAMAFGTPNIFVDIYSITKAANTQYIVTSPTQFVNSLKTILSHYQDAVVETKAVANLFFTPSPEKHFTQFFTDLALI